MTTVLPHLDLDELRRLLLRVEADTHRAGWTSDGSGMTLYILYDGADVVTADHLQRTMGGMGTAIRVGGRYCARVMMANRIFARAHTQTGDPDYVHLRNYAVNVAFASDEDRPADSDLPAGALDVMRALLSLPGIFGFAACYQGWGMFDIDRESVSSSTRLKDQPGARECRIVFAVDAHDRAHRVRRIRGGKPVAETNAPLRGDITTSLRILVDTVYHRLPPATPEGFEGRYPTIEQWAARSGAIVGDMAEPDDRR